MNDCVKHLKLCFGYYRQKEANPCVCVACGDSCFPSSAKVILENGEVVTIPELQIGDKVQTGKSIFVISI